MGMDQAVNRNPGGDVGRQGADTAETLLLFGASGDLSCRMLLPSLFALHRDRLIPPHFRIIGSARSALATGEFRDMVAAALERFVPADQRPATEVGSFLDRLSYVGIDGSDPGSFDVLGPLISGEGPLAIFLSTPPSLYGPTVQGLERAGLTGPRSRIALEKPIGEDLASSHAINDAVHAAFPEERTYRIDHYLGKETVQNLLALRFANLLFEPLWNADCIDHFQITLAETVGLEGRGAFYDGVGALRDMVQNHMLQLLALVAMEPPASFDSAAVRNEKVKVLRSLRPIDAGNVTRATVMGQYHAGMVGEGGVPGYEDDLGAQSGAETFVALKAHVDNWRWKGVPFYLRTGKRLPLRRSEILVQFKDVPHSIFGDSGGLAANKLLIRLQPDESIRFLVMVKEPGLDQRGVRLREVPIDLSLTDTFAVKRQRLSYERLLLDFIQGDSTLFVRRDEVEAQWAWIDAIRAGWRQAGMTADAYAAGSWGPQSAMELVERDGVKWND